MTTQSLALSPAHKMAVAFARILRGAGIDVPLDSVIVFVGALSKIGLENRDDVYWAAYATLIRRHEDTQIFDRAFAVFWDQLIAVDMASYEQQTESVTLLIDSEQEDNDDSSAEALEEDENTLALRFSSVETLREKDFAAYTDSELREAEQFMSSLKLAGPPKRSLRLQKANRKGSRHDIRRTMRAVLQNDGEPIERYWREPSTKLRRLVVLLDISGSMEPYARALLRFMHAAVVGRQRVEAFTLGTRLTRITRELANRDPDRALARTSAQVSDWSGGTRLGECLQNFNDNWGVGSLARGSIFVILSDGWDRGEPQVLAEQMLRLQRVAYRVIWVNPLKVSPGYAPLARGMAAAMPYIDDFVEGHSLEALRELTAVIARESQESSKTRKVVSHA
ncbi:MAG: VWA domain-containing protein [Actinomycetota bacterium]|nr:VWA domain-containing protein [Actinomycetota bacterium]